MFTWREVISHAVLENPKQLQAALTEMVAEQKRPLKETVNALDSDGVTLLIYVATKDFLETFRWLVKEGADINLKGFAGQTPLHQACLNGAGKVAEELLVKHAQEVKANVTNDAKQTPLMLLNQLDEKSYFTRPKPGVTHACEEDPVTGQFKIFDRPATERVPAKAYITDLFEQNRLILASANNRPAPRTICTIL